jgi:hypothetical protein
VKFYFFLHEKAFIVQHSQQWQKIWKQNQNSSCISFYCQPKGRKEFQVVFITNVFVLLSCVDFNLSSLPWWQIFVLHLESSSFYGYIYCSRCYSKCQYFDYYFCEVHVHWIKLLRAQLKFGFFTIICEMMIDDITLTQLLHNPMIIHPIQFAPLVIALLVYLNNRISYPIHLQNQIIIYTTWKHDVHD